MEKHAISLDLQENRWEIQAIFENCSDLVIREFSIGAETAVKAMVVYIDGLVDIKIANQHLFKSLMVDIWETPVAENINQKNVAALVKDRLISVGELKESRQLVELADNVLTGEMALFIDGQDKAFLLGIKKWDQRAVEEPATETVVQGPRDGFTESLRTNTSLIRRRIKTTRLKFEAKKVGLLTKTDICIAYIQGLVPDELVEEVRQRISRINVDSILESGYIEELIEDEAFTPFSLINKTERPDKVAADLLEGRVAIIVDTTPFVLIVPATYPQMLQSPEDYYIRSIFSSFIRILRFVNLNVALLLPSLYVAVVTFHQEMLPTPLLLSIAAAREFVPFPAFVEALVMELTFETLREAGVRLPRPFGQAVSIVGALVIGQAAVMAGLVSPAMVIIVSLTAIANFTIPTVAGYLPIRLLRFPLMFLAATLGLFGIMAGVMAILIHLCSLRSFGVPYLSPVAPFSFRDFKDMIFRFPWWAMFTRPRLVGYKEPARQDFHQRPRKPEPRTRESSGDKHS